MGGEGSGRTKELTSMAEVLITDDEFKSNVGRITIAHYNTVVQTLMDIISGTAVDYVFDAKNGVMVERPAALGDRVRAAKVWKEMTLDKIVSDKKTLDVPENGNLFDLLNTMKEIEEKVETARTEKTKKTEQTLEAEGKLVRLKEGQG